MFKQIAYKVLNDAVMEIPEDVYEAYVHIESNENPKSCDHYKVMLEGIHNNIENGIPPCYDTGTITFYIVAGISILHLINFDIETILKEVTEQLTSEGILRATTLNPLSRYNPNNNLGAQSPKCVVKIKPVNYIEITAVAKGGGSSAFGSAFKVLAPSDGAIGVKKIVFDTAMKGCRYGKICPPAIFGVGIGGSIATTLELAEEAATLRPIGSTNPDPVYSSLEKELYTGINMTGVGYMGIGGDFTTMGVHIEYGLTHSAMLPVGVVSQCFVVHRKTARIENDGSVIYKSHPEWFGD
jgi:tartrate/fumarate subfamily iron-sulfur-dependent hydro-lyase alpha chain